MRLFGLEVSRNFALCTAQQMSWPEIKAAYAELRSARDAEIGLDGTWCERRRPPSPYHLRLVLSTAAQVCGTRARKDCRIVDHGCGSGLPVLYLIALGYEAAGGVNNFATLSSMERGTEEVV